MRATLGISVASMAVATALAFGLPASAGTDAPAPSTTEPPTAPTATTPDPAVASNNELVLPGVVSGGATVGNVLTPPAQPSRSATQTQLFPPPPPPTTTTPPTTIPTFGLPANSGFGRRVVYSKSMQQVWAIDDNGTIIKNHLVSGKLRSCDPSPGVYSVFSRSRYTNSIEKPYIRWGYMVRFAKGCTGGNIGFHEIPFDYNIGQPMQSVSQLGTPLSGGCVRQAVDDAIWMWDWAQLGTTVVVLP